MRVNVYTEEVTGECEVVTADYTSSRTGQPVKNHGLRFILASSPRLHHIPGRDDDRSAVTIWCGADPKGPENFLLATLGAVRRQQHAPVLPNGEVNHEHPTMGVHTD